MLDLESARNLSPETGTESPHPRLGIADLPTDLLALCLDKAYPHGAGSLFLVTVSRTSRAFRAAARQVQLSTRRCKLGHDARAPAAALQLQGGALSSLHNLQELELLNFQGPGVKALVSHAQSCCPRLISLVLSHCTLHQAAWFAIQRLCPQLLALSLNSCTFPDGLDRNTQMPQLQHLDLSWSQHPECHKLLKAAGPSVAHLNLRGCEWVTDHAIAAAGLPMLQELDVSYTPFGDGSLAALAVGCPLLRKLKVAGQAWNLWFCGSWTECALAAFQQAKPQVSVITCA